MFLSENIFKTLLKLQYISLDQQFAGTLFLWEPCNLLKSIWDCEQQNSELWLIFTSIVFKTCLPESWEALWTKLTFLISYHLLQVSTKRLILALKKLGKVFKTAFFVQQTLWGKIWKVYNFVIFLEMEQKKIDCSRLLVIKTVKTAFSVSRGIFR